MRHQPSLHEHALGQRNSALSGTGGSDRPGKRGRRGCYFLRPLAGVLHAPRSPYVPRLRYRRVNDTVSTTSNDTETTLATSAPTAMDTMIVAAPGV